MGNFGMDKGDLGDGVGFFDAEAQKGIPAGAGMTVKRGNDGVRGE